MYGTSSTGPNAEDQPHHCAIGPHSRGLWLMGSDVDLARRLSRVGFDWLALDAQHGAIDRSALVDLGRALGDVDTNFVVRVPGVDHSWIGASLDAGAAGVVIPSVVSVDDARAAVRAAFYPPLGERSWGPLTPMWDGYAPDAERANAQVQCAVMIETTGALEAVEEIAAVDGGQPALPRACRSLPGARDPHGPDAGRHLGDGTGAADPRSRPAS